MLSESVEQLLCQRSRETYLHLLSIECVAVCDDIMDDEHVNLWLLTSAEDDTNWSVKINDH